MMIGVGGGAARIGPRSSTMSAVSTQSMGISINRGPAWRARTRSSTSSSQRGSPSVSRGERSRFAANKLDAAPGVVGPAIEGLIDQGRGHTSLQMTEQRRLDVPSRHLHPRAAQHIRLGVVEHSDQAEDLGRGDGAVGADESQPPCARVALAPAPLDRGPLGPGSGVLHEPEGVHPGAGDDILHRLPHEREAVLAAPVVDDDELQAGVRMASARGMRGHQEPSEPRALVVCWDHDAHVRHAREWHASSASGSSTRS